LIFTRGTKVLTNSHLLKFLSFVESPSGALKDHLLVAKS
jgi:hypothetical protein